MSMLQKVAIAAVGVMMATTLVLPNRQTPQIANSFGNLLTGETKAVEGVS